MEVVGLIPRRSDFFAAAILSTRERHKMTLVTDNAASVAEPCKA